LILNISSLPFSLGRGISILHDLKYSKEEIIKNKIK